MKTYDGSDRFLVLTGMPGARKSDLAHEIARRTCWPIVRLSETVEAFAMASGLPATPEGLRLAAERIRSERGAQAVVELAVLGRTGTLILDGLRSTNELEFLRRAPRRVFAAGVHASEMVRHERMARNSGPELADREALMELDEHNRALGVGTLLTHCDVIVMGSASEEAIRHAAGVVLERAMAFFAEK